MSENLNELPAVARNINLPCKKCECDRFHVVVAHTSATSAKVKCEVCGSQKTYKLKAAQARKTTSSSGGVKRASPRKASGPSAADLWNELRSQIGVDNVVPYEMRKKYALANAINHPKFGVGFVTAATPEKIDVAFQEGGRSLVHNRP
jgi:hypothetical protein